MAADNASAQVFQDVRANDRITALEHTWFKSYTPKFKMVEMVNHPRTEIIKHTTLPEQKVWRTLLPTGETVVIKMLSLEGHGHHVFNAGIHEAFIGLKGLNPLNLPCFARILDFNLAPRSNYVMYQDAGSIALCDYIPRTTPSDLQGIVCKLIDGLHRAHTLIDFTHYDLHLRNVMVKDGEPIIIDYGWAHIKKSHTHYGAIMRDGSIHNGSMWYHDIVKILMSILSECTIELVMVAHKSDLTTQYKEHQDHRLTLEQDLALELLSKGRTSQRLRLELKHIKVQLRKIKCQFKAAEVLPRPYELAGWLRTLLQFFDPSASFDALYLHTYRETYKYFQPSDEMISRGYDFDQFIIYLMAHTPSE